jgi:hypothetical protein
MSSPAEVGRGGLRPFSRHPSGVTRIDPSVYRARVLRRNALHPVPYVAWIELWPGMADYAIHGTIAGWWALKFAMRVAPRPDVRRSKLFGLAWQGFHRPHHCRNLSAPLNRIGCIAPVFEGILVTLRSARRHSAVDRRRRHERAIGAGQKGGTVTQTLNRGVNRGRCHFASVSH